LRAALASWWWDASARDLAHGVRGVTVPVAGESSLAKVSASNMQPGDLAITKDGLHMLVYFGNGRWIEADPTLRRVVILDPSHDDNPWLHSAVLFYRWKQLN
jgi:cell wall-associated NlpC family hydrolase